MKRHERLTVKSNDSSGRSRLKTKESRLIGVLVQGRSGVGQGLVGGGGM